MRSIGSPTPSAPAGRTTLWGTVIGMAVLVVIFVVALLQAANANSLLGWVLAGIALGWLMLAAWVVLMVRRAARFGRSQVEEAQRRAGRAPAAAQGGPAGSMRDEKLAHSFQIVLVQSKVIKQQLAGLPAGGVDREAVDRALDTIDITAGNGMSMLREEPLSGTVVD